MLLVDKKTHDDRPMSPITNITVRNSIIGNDAQTQNVFLSEEILNAKDRLDNEKDFQTVSTRLSQNIDNPEYTLVVKI